MTRWFASSFLACTLLSGSAAQADLVDTWVQFVPGDQVRLRAIETNPSLGCPTASVDGVTVAMAQRGDSPTAAQQPKTYYPVLMCESAPLPAFGSTKAMIGGVALKMPTANPKRILFVGDTGCRVTTAVSGTQNCNDPTQFPLQIVSNYAATFKPDLIVHVGDFFYREQPCPTGFSGCAGSATFDNWDSWYQDWFKPAANLLKAAPVALTRGNHESCNRGARGWFRLLDPNAYDANAVECVGTYNPMPGAPGTKVSYIGPYDVTPPYVVKAGQVALLMFDSSDANTSGDTGTVKTIASATGYTPTAGLTLTQVYEQQLGAVLPGLAGQNVFYVTHKAPYDIRSNAQQNPSVVPGATYVGGDFTQQNVLAQLNGGPGVPAAIKAFIAGHDHQFQAVSFSNSSYAPQVLTGNSGTLLDQNSGTQPQTFTPDATYTYAPATNNPVYGAGGTGALVNVQLIADQALYGFTVMDAVTGGYTVTSYNVSGPRTARCALTLNPRSIVCSQ